MQNRSNIYKQKNILCCQICKYGKISFCSIIGNVCNYRYARYFDVWRVLRYCTGNGCINLELYNLPLTIHKHTPMEARFLSRCWSDPLKEFGVQSLAKDTSICRKETLGNRSTNPATSGLRAVVCLL